MDTMRSNDIMNAVMHDVPEDEVCENDEERLQYRLLKAQRENPATSGTSFDTVAD